MHMVFHTTDFFIDSIPWQLLAAGNPPQDWDNRQRMRQAKLNHLCEKFRALFCLTYVQYKLQIQVPTAKKNEQISSKTYCSLVVKCLKTNGTNNTEKPCYSKRTVVALAVFKIFKFYNFIVKPSVNSKKQTQKPLQCL